LYPEAHAIATVSGEDGVLKRERERSRL
jgi:hypothetical protein